MSIINSITEQLEVTIDKSSEAQKQLDKLSGKLLQIDTRLFKLKFGKFEKVEKNINLSTQAVKNMSSEMQSYSTGVADIAQKNEALANSVEKTGSGFQKFRDSALGIWDGVEKSSEVVQNIGDFLSKLHSNGEDSDGAGFNFGIDPDKLKNLEALFAPLQNVAGTILGINDALTQLTGCDMSELFTKLTALFGNGGFFGPGGLIAGASTPILLLIAGLASLAAGLGYVFATNENVRQSFSDALGTISDSFTPAMEFISNTVVPDLQEGFRRFLEILQPLGDFLTEMFTSIWMDMIVPAMQYIGTEVIPALTGAFENLWNYVLVPLGSFLGDVLTPIFSFIADLLSSLWNNVILPLADAIGNILAKAFEGLVALFNEMFVPGLNNLISVFQFLWDEVLSPIVDFLAEVFKPVFDEVFKAIGEIIDGLSKTFGGLIDFIVGTFTGNWDKAWKGVQDIFYGIWDALSGLVKIPLNAIIALFEGIANKIIDGWNAVKSLLNGFSFTIPDFVPEFGGQTVGFDLAMSHHISLQRFANGGYLNTGEMFIARERGPELVGRIGNRGAVVNNDQIVESIRAAVVDGMMEVFNASGNISAYETPTLDFTFMVDSETAYHLVEKGRMKADRRYHVVAAT
ncbi:hypothetical protein KTH81_18085 [Lachnospiraceae bacterium ASD3451]|uniref:phage tail protein n=1 Tax=Diplocloster agilis TaxID=2850323 RepID=UPI001D265952|nr:hypothetical protein [Diplocloster agilis]MBU9745737.1 hypothetical protein [Diplocloster agilis]